MNFLYWLNWYFLVSNTCLAVVYFSLPRRGVTVQILKPGETPDHGWKKLFRGVEYLSKQLKNIFHDQFIGGDLVPVELDSSVNQTDSYDEAKLLEIFDEINVCNLIGDNLRLPELWKQLFDHNPAWRPLMKQGWKVTISAVHSREVSEEKLALAKQNYFDRRELYRTLPYLPYEDIEKLALKLREEKISVNSYLEQKFLKREEGKFVTFSQ